MGMTIWYLGIDDMNNLYRLPTTIFDGTETKFKNQIFKIVEIIIELKNREPQKLVRIIYYKIKFNDLCVFDKSYSDEQTGLLIKSIGFSREELTNDQIIARERHQFLYKWIPTYKETKLINQYLSKKGLPLDKLLR